MSAQKLDEFVVRGLLRNPPRGGTLLFLSRRSWLHWYSTRFLVKRSIERNTEIPEHFCR
jgi:hypothetical protein